MTSAAALRGTVLAAFLMASLVVAAPAARAARSIFKIYGIDQGLSEVGAVCLDQDPHGVLLLCTQHGVFTYDGRRFLNLGQPQGLRDGGNVYNLAIGQDGRIALSYPDEVFVSGPAERAGPALASASFHAVRHEDLAFFNGLRPHQLAAWRGSFAFLAHGKTWRIDLSRHDDPRLLALDYAPNEASLLQQANAVFAVDGRLWESVGDDRLCLADPRSVACFDGADGLPSGPWVDVADRGDGTVVARSPSMIATFDAARRRWSAAMLPDQGGQYANYTLSLGLFRTPDGELATQAAHGLDVLRPSGWTPVAVPADVVTGPIEAAMTDAHGQFWLAILGQGLVRWIGFGRWETLQRADGLSADIAWQTARTPDGSIWVTTDGGLDRLSRKDGALVVADVVPGSSFALSVSRDGDVWSSRGNTGGTVVRPGSDQAVTFASPPIDSFDAQGADAMWVGTEAGLFLGRRTSSGEVTLARTGSPTTPVLDIEPDGRGGIYYIAGLRLRHRRADGFDELVPGPWPGHGFEPYEFVLGKNGRLWAGGAGGLFEMTIADDRLVSSTPVPTADTQSNSISALLLDHRGWLWAGTSLGVSVFDGQRWVSIDEDDGLVYDNVAQGGLREDPDGSIWIATGRGISHLIHPELIFVRHPLDLIVGDERLGGGAVTTRHVRFSRAALDVELGIANFGTASSVSFEYRMSGVDQGWQTSGSGLLHYPSLPPGKHVLSIVAIDTLTHARSAVTTLTFRMDWPWYQRWWAKTAFVVVILAAIVAATRLSGRARLRAALAREAELRRLVEIRTAEYRFLAEHDRLTGLLTRSEIEQRLARRLLDDAYEGATLIALLDLDHFKRINDTAGHLIGDQVLTAVGQIVAKHLRQDDDAGRYGGEELLLVFDDGDGQATGRLMATFEAIRSRRFDTRAGQLAVTCSVGVAWAQAGDDWESLLVRADDALYRAKHEGRDRVVEFVGVNPAPA